MALINRPMYEQFGARHLGVKGPGALTQLEEGVMGTLPLDLSSDFAYWYIQGFRTFAGSVFQAGVGSQYSSVGLSLEDVTDQWLARIISIDCSISSQSGAQWEGSIYRCARSAYSSDAGIEGHSTDTRVAEGQPSQSIIVNGNHASPPGTLLTEFDTANDPDILKSNRIPLLVSPGQVIYVQHNTVDTNFQVGICWVEIPAYKAEL
jgi:hypothetical protein